MPREITRVAREIRESDSASPPSDPLKRALAEPNNLGAQFNAIWRTRDLKEEIFVHLPNWQTEDEPPQQPRLEDWLTRIETKFSEPWILPCTTSVRLSQMENGFSFFPRSGTLAEQRLWLKKNSNRKPLELKQKLEQGAKREPLNAFWIVALARWEWEFGARTFYPAPRSNFAYAQPSIDSFAPVALPSPPMVLGRTGAIGGPPPVVSGAPAPAPFVLGAPGAGPGVPGAASQIIPMGPHPLPLLVPNEEAVLKRTFAILERARRCTYFQDGQWQMRREMARDWARSEPPSLEGEYSRLSGSSYALWSGSLYSLPGYLQSALWGGVDMPNIANSIVIPYDRGTPSQALAQRLKPRQLVIWGAALTHISRLVDQGPRLAFPRKGRYSFRWLRAGWSLDQMRVKNAKGDYVFPFTGTAQTFAIKARLLGLSELAREALAIEKEFAARDALVSKADGGHYEIRYDSVSTGSFWGADALYPRFAFLSPLLCDVIAATALLLVPVWMFLNLWLIDGKGESSSSRSRWGISLIVAALVGLPIYWYSVGWFTNADTVSPIFYNAYPALLFAGAVAVLLAVYCLCVTVARHHEKLISTEDERWHTHFISRGFRPWVEPFLLGISASLALIAALVLVYFSSAMVPATAPLPLGFIGIYVMRDAFVALGGYALVTGSGALILLLFNWRMAPKRVASITHGGLRWWKETIGASICVLVWLYLVVALAVWPARTQGKRMIAERWQMGDWVWLQKNL